MRTILLFYLLFVIENLSAQTVVQKLDKAWSAFIKDEQLRHAIVGFSVVDSKTGKPIFERNAQVGLAPASTQKIITSVAAFELLGKDYRYKTELGYNGEIKNGILDGNLYLIGSGDPTLGTWRWPVTKDSVLLLKWLEAVRSAKIKKISGTVSFDWSRYSYQAIPDGWVWQDIGNYYGAGAYVLNWKENQFDMKLKSGNQLNKPVQIISTDRDYVNELKTARAGSGDNAFAYLPISSGLPLVKGTIPVNENSFTISLADPDPIENILISLSWYLQANGIQNHPGESHHSFRNGSSFDYKPIIISEHWSPNFDSINFYFLRKSVNLYGEALIKTLAYNKTGFGDTESGITVLLDFLATKGFEKASLNIVDGSGLSPQNRVTTDALVRVLQYGRARSWFPSFYNALPEYNGMKMKSGSIGGVRAYAGYHKATSGKEYSFCIIVNNFDGPSAEIVKKMYKLLDALK